MKHQGWIEMHSHVLPHLDDGSNSIMMSLDMLRREAAQGVSIVCATPHYYADQVSIGRFCQRREVSFQMLRSALPYETLPRIIPATEVAFFSGMGECAGLEQLCIRGTRTLMLEMPFTEWNDFQIEEVSALVLDRGFHVVLVHPERFCGSKNNVWRLKELAELPVAFQVNAGTLIRWRTRKLGLKLLQETQYPLLGSDCHNLTTRPPNLAEGRGVVARKLGEAFLMKMDRSAARLIEPAAEKVVP